MELEWEEPPPRASGTRGGTLWSAIAAELRKRPGEWACVARNRDCTTGSNIVRGRYAGMPAGEFEATTRRTEPGSKRYDVWARYVGPVTP